jgi:predicted nucleic acid-binding protein
MKSAGQLMRAVTTKIAREAGKLVNRYRPSHSVEIPDAIIVATYLVSGEALHTLDVKHYPMFKGLMPLYSKHWNNHCARCFEADEGISLPNI